jgi:phosphohistidine phosphatase SixA
MQHTTPTSLYWLAGLYVTSNNVRLLHLALAASVAGSLVGCGGGPPAAPTAAAPGSATPSPPESATAPSPGPSTERPAAGDKVELLRRGGYIVYIRHAITGTVQDDPSPDLSDPRTQRTLSPAGRAQARRIGAAVRRLGIPIGQVLASPYHRTRQTAELAFGAARVRATRELISEGHPGTDDAALARDLRRLLRQRPDAGANTVLVSHGFNLAGATGLSAAEGEAVIFDPGGRQPLEPIARIGADEWRTLRG